MDAPSGFRHPGGGPRRGRGRQAHGPQNPQLFQDTSTVPQHPQGGYEQPPGPGYGPPPQQYAGGYGSPPAPGYSGSPEQHYMGQQLFQDPMAGMAMQYGTSLAGQGKDLVQKNIEKYVSTSKVKDYFDVDTVYVCKKLGLLVFPFTHTEWSVRYQEPVTPRMDINVPDLYIPVMAFVTYILTAGVALGIQNRFTPEQLGIQSSSALVWLIIEMLVIWLSLYITNVQSDIKYLDLVAFCGYKYVGMILSLVAGLIFHSGGYYFALLWSSLTLAFFLVRTLKMKILAQPDGYSQGSGSKSALYMLVFIALVQPLFMWWLTSHIMFVKAPIVNLSGGPY
ncbi:protein YIF1B-A [Lingula anatina]|uniref:Protein YIF1 n=1 Tax=Lingula anatina TaxID=7574 RepID=A0A1S3JZ90_LINAN|nr:protein YIF1B-A [Lingula anatina]|eukprot:XP_013415404.1 protein YIF1B-A [Lingula anatina]